MHDPGIVVHLESRLARFRYVAIGECHLYGADADLPVMRRVVELAREHKLFLHSRSDAEAIDRQFRQNPEARILWAHCGFDSPEKVMEMLGTHQNLWCDLAFRNDHAGGEKDPGRHGGLRKLQARRMSRLGPYDDAGDADPAAALTRHLLNEHRHFGEFRVPGLRQLVHTAPYMHDGSLATIEQVVRNYDDLDEERLHADGQRILRPLNLNAQQAGDLAVFLRSLGR